MIFLDGGNLNPLLFKFEQFWCDTYFEIYYPISCFLTQSFQDIIYQFSSALDCHHQHQFYGTVFQMVMVWKAGFAISLPCLPAFLWSEGLPSCLKQGGLWLCLHSPLNLLKEADVPRACSLRPVTHTETRNLFRCPGIFPLGLGILQTLGDMRHRCLVTEVVLSLLASWLNLYFPISFYFLSFSTHTLVGLNLH